MAGWAWAWNGANKDWDDILTTNSAPDLDFSFSGDDTITFGPTTIGTTNLPMTRAERIDGGGGQAARVLQTTKPGDDNRKLPVQVVDGDGTLVFQSDPIGIDHIEVPLNFGATQTILDPAIAGLPDGGFAIAWNEQCLIAPNNLNSAEQDT